MTQKLTLLLAKDEPDLAAVIMRELNTNG